MIFKLKYCDYHIRPDITEVQTVFPATHGVSVCYGTREVNPNNIREARSQGYDGPDDIIVWRSLVEHELLHSLVAEVMFDQPSLVLSTEAGLGFTPSWLRYEEEMLAISLQYYFNTNDMPAPLSRYELNGLKKLSKVWLNNFEPKLSELWGV